eukprot:scaffold300148_cov22-Tisochrysis_lutea.AAC.1
MHRQEAAQAVQSTVMHSCTLVHTHALMHTQEAAQAVQSTLSRIAEVEAQMATATDMCASNRIDVGDMAESLGAAFQQVIWNEDSCCFCAMGNQNCDGEPGCCVSA